MFEWVTFEWVTFEWVAIVKGSEENGSGLKDSGYFRKDKLKWRG